MTFAGERPEPGHMQPQPLLIRQLLFSPACYNPEQEIVYRGALRLTYRDLRERVQRLAGALAALGVRRGDTVAVMDWDSHRYLECFFAVPMLGAVLQTVNVRLSPQQILFTLGQTRPTVLLANPDFIPLLDEMGEDIRFIDRVVLMPDEAPVPAPRLPVVGERRFVGRCGSQVRLSGVSRRDNRDHVPYDRDHRPSEGGLFQPSPDRAAHAFPDRDLCDATRSRPV
ncbi:AMP-binding protein [Seohaeicola zhoushanensis]